MLLLTAVAIVVWGSGVWWFAFLAVPVVLFFATGILFFRNPDRRVPGEPGVLVAPADGKVVEIDRVEEGEFIRGPALKVGIFLSIFDVHVNRAPAESRVDYLRYRPGDFLDAREERSKIENESQSIGSTLTGPGPERGLRTLVRQISGAIARRIICPLTVDTTVRRGGLIGMIKYGSRTELYLQDPGATDSAGTASERASERASEDGSWEVAVRIGQHVRGGKTVIFRRRTSGGMEQG